jgi:hypothetical protein
MHTVTFVCVCICTHMYVRRYWCPRSDCQPWYDIFVCMHMCACKYLLLHVFLCMCVCIYIYSYICGKRQLHIHAYIHTCHNTCQSWTLACTGEGIRRVKSEHTYMRPICMRITKHKHIYPDKYVQTHIHREGG